MESLDEEQLVLLLLWWRRRRRKKDRQNWRQFWVRPILQKRRSQGEFYNLLQEMRLNDPDSHFRYLRMSKSTFDHLLAKVGPFLSRRPYMSDRRPNISPGERLALTIRYLATGNSQTSLSFNFRIGRSTVSNIVKETCSAIWDVLVKDYVKAPSTAEDWRGIGFQFAQLWNFPNCIGAIDGKHIVIQAPAGGGSMYYNYKGSHSIVLMAVCDAHYRFTLVDIGNTGRHSDGGVFSNSSFGQAIESSSLAIPPPRALPGTSTEAPFVFVGDEAFPLRKDLLRPYPGRYLADPEAIFNYRLSRARRVIENSFGILAARWRIFRRPIIATPDHVVLFTKAAIALHNYLRTTEASVYCPPGFTDGEDGEGNMLDGAWRSETSTDEGLQRIGQMAGNRYGQSAAEVRQRYRDYFLTPEGEVSWQYNHIHRTS